MVLKIQKQLEITTILVTHDKEEALMMAHNIALMLDGKIIQYGTPKEIYERPNCKKAANFFGERNYFKGRVVKNRFYCDLGEIEVKTEKQGDLELMINPENIKIHADSIPKSHMGEIISSQYAGDRIYYTIKYKDKNVKVTDYNNNLLSIGQKIYFTVDFSKSILIYNSN
ncbi:hypothetical protein [Clostridium sp. Marseille-Q2269]|uniref:hypothetical protein n=1 Tax=Clostridium sp. Marseille-Q2269 TaxID=2942205 RepID=UPI002073852B|nr:hypothetical protein [Clostridium sp. Marseille-Q2269]